MKLLALDTAMAACSAAVIDTAHPLPLAKAWAAMERGHAEALAPMVKQVMTEAGIPFSALERIVVTIGPGTFTGVRIGLAMARGLGLALGIPVIGIDALSAIAGNCPREDQPLLVVADARNGEVYGALFEGGKLAKPPAVITVDSLLSELPPGPFRVMGTAAENLIAQSGRDDLERFRGSDLPNAASFGPPGALHAAPDAMPQPLYLRAPDAKPQTPANSLRIRSIGAAESPVLAAIHRECSGKPWDEEAFAKLLATGAEASLAQEGDEPLGFILTRAAADETEIIMIATRPFARRRGIAKALVRHQAKDLASRGITRFFLEVASLNQPARQLYAACGFKEAGVRKAYYAGDDAIVMRMELQA
jgi:tRNA threonylcarbamoyladenosine biosynthesis protein TsaB